MKYTGSPGGGGFGGGFHSGGGGFGGGAGFDAFNMFEEMFANAGGGGRRQGGGGIKFNFGGGGGGGGFPGGGGFGGGGGQPQDLFPKGGPVVRLGKPKFPDKVRRVNPLDQLQFWICLSLLTHLAACLTIGPIF